ncbi:hypothetical protein JZ751_017924, partial [Albula glossodonta]
SEVSKLQVPGGSAGEQQYGGASGPGRRCCLTTQQDRRSPTGRAESTSESAVEEQLFRSVEGQAASDEEEEKWTGEQQTQVDEVKRILTRLSCCGDRCDDKAVKKLLSHFGGAGGEESQTAVVELLEKMKDSLVLELQQKAEETEHLHLELQMLETERVRLSLVEEKLMDKVPGKDLVKHIRVLQRPSAWQSPHSGSVECTLSRTGCLRASVQHNPGANAKSPIPDQRAPYFLLTKPATCWLGTLIALSNVKKKKK